MHSAVLVSTGRLMECFLSPRRVRTIFKCVSFGAVLLWILLGNYMRHEDKPASLSTKEAAGGEGGMVRSQQTPAV